MRIEGSCHCGAVHFTAESPEPVPFLRCYCSICRKTNGSGGYGVNIGALTETLEVAGAEHICHYDPATGATGAGEPASGQSGRRFCGRCGSGLWNWDDRWGHLFHPLAGAVDTSLPAPPVLSHMMLGSKASWVEVEAGPEDKRFGEYPDESLADWHARHGLGG